MRYGKTIFLLVTLALFAFGDSFADDVQFIEVVDLVYEWSLEGEAIQVGDYMISEFDSVWTDTGDGELIMVGRSAIKLGGLVKTLLIGKDENGFWIADRVIVLVGDGVDSAIEALPEAKRQQLTSSQESNATDNDNTPTSHQSGGLLYEEDGVWKN